MLKKPKLLVLGVHTKSEAYPNTLFRIQFLKSLPTFSIAEINYPLLPLHRNCGNQSLWTAIWKGGVAHLKVLLGYFHYVWEGGRPDILYAPYPAILTVALLSILPKIFRPKKIFLDGFISLYDTVVLDRGLLEPNTCNAKLLYKVERCAFRLADSVIVDTAENIKYLAELYKLSFQNFVAIPLSTDQIHFTPTPYSTNSNRVCTVLFIGTMIPLHGIHVVAGTIEKLRHREDIHFILIGEGQESSIIDSISPLPMNTIWHRNWMSSANLAQAIQSADICLGIFGSGDKSQRVCPYKIYAYASVGKAIITGRTRWSLAAEKVFAQQPFALIEPNNSEALVEKIIELAQNIEVRIHFANASSRFYQNFLSNAIAHEMLEKLLYDSNST